MTARAHAAPLAAVSALAVLIVAIVAVTGVQPAIVMAPPAALLAFAATHQTLLRWRTLVGLTVAVILLIPIRRYEFQGGLPIQLEPYRLLVAIIALLWVAALLIEPRVRARHTPVDVPLMLFLLAALASVAVNAQRVASLDVQPEVIKKLTFFASFVIVMYVITSVCVRRADIDAVVRLLVAGGALLAGLAIIESRTGFNPFNHLKLLLPGVQFDPQGLPDAGPAYLAQRGGRARAYGSAQHPIALGAALVLILPLGIHVARRNASRAWWAAVGLTAVGALATLSRTAVVMLVTEIVMIMVLKPQTRRLWPLLLPFLAVVHLAIPGALGSIKGAFFPAGGIVAEQQSGAGTYGSGRLADLDPGLREWSRRPLLGQGFATRISDRTDPKVNAPILDDQWLNVLLETGIVGFAALWWLFARAVRAMTARAREGPEDRSWLAVGLAAAILAFAVGMTTYDAFSFIQVTLLLFILLGISAAELHSGRWRR